MKIGIATLIPLIEVCGRFHTPVIMLPIVSFTSVENNGIVIGMLLGLSILYCKEYPV